MVPSKDLEIPVASTVTNISRYLTYDVTGRRNTTSRRYWEGCLDGRGRTIGVLDVIDYTTSFDQVGCFLRVSLQSGLGIVNLMIIVPPGIDICVWTDGRFWIERISVLHEDR